MQRDGFTVTPIGSRMFALDGELDVHAIPTLDRALRETIAESGPMVLDMTAVSFMDSSGIGAVLRALRSLPTGCIILHGIQDHVSRAWEMAGLDGAPRLHLIRCTKEDQLAPTIGARPSS